MKLSEQQQLHSLRVGLLLLYLPVLSANTGKKYTVAIADAQSAPKNKPQHRRGSFHFKKLAIDLDLFIDGVYQRSTEAHRPLGEFWISIGGIWGGDFPNGQNFDGNHYES